MTRWLLTGLVAIVAALSITSAALAASCRVEPTPVYVLQPFTVYAEGLPPGTINLERYATYNGKPFPEGYAEVTGIPVADDGTASYSDTWSLSGRLTFEWVTDADEELAVCSVRVK